MGRADELRKRHAAKSQQMGMGRPEPSPKPVEVRRKSPLGLIFTVVILLVLAGGGVFWGLRWQSQRDTSPSRGRPLASSSGSLDLPAYIVSSQDSSGQRVEVPRDGTVTIPAADGGKGMVFNFRNGKLHGEQLIYSGHKRPLRVFNCVDGEMHGSDTFFDLKGRVRRELLWENGKSMGVQ